MHERDKRLTVPDGHPYIVVGVPGDARISGDHHFRLPSPIEAVRLAAAQQADALRGVGVVLGRCWHHRDVALDAEVPRPGTVTDDELLDAGERVIEELHDAGYRQELQVLMARAVWSGINDSNTISEEVQARLDSFGGASSGGSGGASSSTTSATDEAPSPA